MNVRPPTSRISAGASLAPRYAWRKLASAKWADAWEERLRGLDSSRLAIIQAAGARGLRLEFYCRHRSEADQLKRRFGGTVRAISPAAWHPGEQRPAPPLVFGSSLVVTGDEEKVAELRRRHPRRAVLCVPAALAFGSGEHATTAMCLRLLAQAAAGRARGSWTQLDLGTGSGILALAGRALGAKEAAGLDYDPVCVRTARENARRNHLTGVTFAVADVLAWRPARRWNVVTANLFLNVLLAILPRLRRALSADGELVLSGVLAEQAAAVIARAQSAQLDLVAQRRRGPWRALHFRPRTKRVAKRRAPR